MLAMPRMAVMEGVNEFLLKNFEQDGDRQKFPFNGAIYYAIGISFPILFIKPVEITCAIIMVLVVGDSMSTIIGKLYGRHKFGKKSIEGSIGFMVSGFLGALVFVNPILALAFAFIGAVLESISILDDNISIPLGLTIFYLSLYYLL